jgi:hypothetical protein
VDLEIRCPIAVYITPENMTGVSEFSCREGDVSLFLYHFLCWDEISARGGRIGRQRDISSPMSNLFKSGFLKISLKDSPTARAPSFGRKPIFDPHPARPFCASVNGVLSRP